MNRQSRNNSSNNNGRTASSNGQVDRRLLITFAVLVLAGLLKHLFMVHEHLQNTDYIEQRLVRDEPQNQRRTDQITKSVANEKTKTEQDAAVTMTTSEYLKLHKAASTQTTIDRSPDNRGESKEEAEEEEKSNEEEEGDSNEEENGPDEAEEKKSGEDAEKEENDANKEEEKEEKKKYEEPEECEKKTKRMNVVFFYADDWTMKVMGKLDKRVKTPNIDAMADNGMIFTNNCVTTSVCWASRATLLTGTYLGVHKHSFPYDNNLFENKVWSDTLYAKMRKGSGSSGPSCRDGYYTGLFGKWHGLEIEDEFKEAFDEVKVYYGNHWEERDGKMQHVTELNKKDSIQFLNNWQERFGDKKEKQPFFLTASFFATHARDGEFPSYQPQNSTRLNIYPDSIEITPPKTATEEHYQRLPRFLIDGNNEGRTRWKKRFEPKDFQSNIKDIYAMATEVDEAVGEIIEKIKSLGVYDETILIFTTDNGNLHGEHGLAEKWYPFEESMRVPLVIQDPRMPKNRRGTMSDAWTLNVDLAPTILGAANIPLSDFMQGRDISDLYLNNNDAYTSLSVDELKKKVEWRNEWFYEFNMGKENDGLDHPWQAFIDASFALVNDEWKYVYWPQHNYEQLFHRSVDPFDEWDLLNKIFRQKATNTPDDKNVLAGEPEKTQSRQIRGIDNKNGCCDTVQTTAKMYKEMKQRYAVAKEKAHKGERI